VVPTMHTGRRAADDHKIGHWISRCGEETETAKYLLAPVTIFVRSWRTPKARPIRLGFDGHLGQGAPIG